MTKSSKSGVMTVSLAGAAMMMALIGSAGQAWASGQASLNPSQGRAFEASRGPAYVTGTLGSMQTTTLPGSAGQGLLMNNGNGTSTLLAPGAVPQVVATPR